jgi:hypothetical protein
MHQSLHGLRWLDLGIDIMLCRRELLTSRAAASHILCDTRKTTFQLSTTKVTSFATNLDRFGIYLESTARLLRDLPHHAYRFRRSHRSTTQMEQDDSQTALAFPVHHPRHLPTDHHLSCVGVACICQQYW